MIDFFAWLKEKTLTEGVLYECRDTDVIRQQINGLFDNAIRSLIDLKLITKFIPQANSSVGYDWWSFLVKTMRNYPYKGQDLYDAATHLAGDLWERCFNPEKYEDRHPPLCVFHSMASLRAQDIAFRFFGWRRKLKTTSIGGHDPTHKSDMLDDISWTELQNKLIKAIEKECVHERNAARAKRAIDVAKVKLYGFSDLHKKEVRETGLDSLASFYYVSRKELYDTLIIIYRAIKKLAKDDEDLLSKVIGELPDSMNRELDETILSLIPANDDISHSELFTKAYSSNRELKSLVFRQIIQDLSEKKLISVRKDDRVGKHQVLYRKANNG